MGEELDDAAFKELQGYDYLIVIEEGQRLLIKGSNFRFIQDLVIVHAQTLKKFRISSLHVKIHSMGLK